MTELIWTENGKWNFLARDIFATPDGSDSFEVIDDKIKSRDGYEYILKEHGRKIR